MGELVKKSDAEQLKKYLVADKCFAILKTGKNKNNQCSRNKYNDTDFCKAHCKTHLIGIGKPQGLMGLVAYGAQDIYQL